MHNSHNVKISQTSEHVEKSMMMANHFKNFTGDTPIEMILKIKFKVVTPEHCLMANTDVSRDDDKYE